jgi:hypothetical protein
MQKSEYLIFESLPHYILNINCIINTFSLLGVWKSGWDGFHLACEVAMEAVKATQEIKLDPGA